MTRKNNANLRSRRRQIQREIANVARIWNFLLPIQQERYEKLAEEYDRLGAQTKENK
jgi:hypothetical protein